MKRKTGIWCTERSFANVSTSAERSLPFPDLPEYTNVKVLSRVELLAEFDSLMSEHPGRITDKQKNCYAICLGKIE